MFKTLQATREQRSPGVGSNMRPKKALALGARAIKRERERLGIRRSQLVQRRRTRFVLRKDDVDLRIGRDGYHHAAVGGQAHDLGITRITNILAHSFSYKVVF
jgi:hypothetical protein